MPSLRTRVFVATAAIGAIAFSVSAASEFLPYAQTLANDNIINPQSSEAGYFLSENLLRAQAVKLSLGTAGLGQKDCRTLSSLTFSDVTPSMGDLCGFIEGAVANNIITKTNGFYPYQPISRSNFADLIVGAFDVSTSGLIPQVSSGDIYFSDVPATLFNANSINRLATTSCINVGGIFRPSDYITRGESFKIMSCLLNKRLGGDIGLTSSNISNNNIGLVVTGYSYNWTPSSYGSCSMSCGEGVQIRTVTCQRSDGVTMTDSYCLTLGSKPAVQKLCNVGICAAGTTGTRVVSNNATTAELISSVTGIALSCLGKSIETPSLGVFDVTRTGNQLYSANVLYASSVNLGDVVPSSASISTGSTFSFSVKIRNPKASIAAAYPGKYINQKAAILEYNSSISNNYKGTEQISLSLTPGDFSNPFVVNGDGFIVYPKEAEYFYINYKTTNYQRPITPSGFNFPTIKFNGLINNPASGEHSSFVDDSIFETTTTWNAFKNQFIGASWLSSPYLQCLSNIAPWNPATVSPPPTASILLNGTKNGTNKVGQTYTRAWSSTNANSWSSIYRFSGSSCAKNGVNGVWSANTANGGNTSTAYDATFANCTLTITYTATNTTTGLSTTDTATLNIVPADTPLNTGSTVACLGKNIETPSLGVFTTWKDIVARTGEIVEENQSLNGNIYKINDTPYTIGYPTVIIPPYNKGAQFSFSIKVKLDVAKIKNSFDNPYKITDPAKKYIIYKFVLESLQGGNRSLFPSETMSLSLTPGDFTNTIGQQGGYIVLPDTTQYLYINYKTTNYTPFDGGNGPLGLLMSWDFRIIPDLILTENELKNGIVKSNGSTSYTVKYFGSGGSFNQDTTSGNSAYFQCVSSLIDSGNLSALTNQSNGNNNSSTSPTASILLNGTKNGTNKVGQTYTRSWSSTNANSWSSTYRFSGASCAKNGATGTWQANTANGSSTSAAYDATFANCTLTITYTATNTTTGLSTTDTATLNIVPANTVNPVTSTTYGSCSNNGVTSTMYYRMPGSTYCEGAQFNCVGGQIQFWTQFSPAPPTPPAGATIYKYNNCSNTASTATTLTISNATSTIDLTTGTTASTAISNIAQENTLACTEILNAGTSTTIKSNAGYCSTASNFIQKTPSTEWQYNGIGWNVNYNRYSTTYMNTPGLKMAYYIKDKVSGKQVVWYLNVTTSLSNSTLPTTACSTATWKTIGTFSCDAQNKQIQTISSCLPSGYDNANLWNWNKTTNTFSHMTGYSCDGVAHGGYPATTNPSNNTSSTTPPSATTYLGTACSTTARMSYSYRMAGSTYCYGALFSCINGKINFEGTQFSPAPPQPPAGTVLYTGSCQ